jgi:hypothetical protein
MRLLRVLTVAIGFAAVLSQPGAAQANRQFKDAWFWGLKAGALSYSSQSTDNGGAPLLGAEWLITRTKGGLYLSFDQAFLNTTGGFRDRDPDSSFTALTRLKNLRRYTVAGMVFPIQRGNLHPYGGLGAALNHIGGAALQTGSSNPARYAIALDSIQSKKAAISPIFIGGVQAKYRPMSAFVQVTASPMQQGFFLASPNSNKAFNFSLEFGARYNVGSSIEKVR